jgi:hypothetical protein
VALKVTPAVQEAPEVPPQLQQVALHNLLLQKVVWVAVVDTSRVLAAMVEIQKILQELQQAVAFHFQLQPVQVRQQMDVSQREVVRVVLATDYLQLLVEPME